MDKTDVVDSLASAVLATADSEEEGTLVLEVANHDRDTVEVFMVRVTKYRPGHLR